MESFGWMKILVGFDFERGRPFVVIGCGFTCTTSFTSGMGEGVRKKQVVDVTDEEAERWE